MIATDTKETTALWNKLPALLDHSGTAAMALNQDLTVVYANAAAKKSLRALEEALDEFGLDANRIQGAGVANIPGPRGRQLRRLLGETAKLPLRQPFALGGQTFDVCVSSIAEGGEARGLLVTWQESAGSDPLMAGEIEAIHKSQAVIEFRLDGTILTANENFLKAVGYSLDEIKGKHHGMFVEAAYRDSAEYRDFWARLNRGEYQSGEFRRFGKGGREVWIQASYNPILDRSGKPVKVVKYAADITAQKLAEADSRGQLAAIGKSQAVIEFRMDGTILAANANFLAAVGYGLDDIKGRHHGMFVEESYRNSAEYREFWAKLNRGEYQAGEYRRVGQGGREIWIQASYNPILDASGKPFKVVKYASDITAQTLTNADYAGQIAAISKSQAVIEFQLDGTIVSANDNFLSVMGYRMEEVKGRPHGIFVEESYRNSSDYREFWNKLRRGEYQAGEFKRIANGGKEVWIQASYNPILDKSGRPFKVVKYATDITAQKVQAADYSGQIAAISKSQAVIEFRMDGTIVTANANFLGAVGYSIEEIRGKHHSMFVEPAYTASADYREFWAKLNRGEYQAAEYKRIGKGGKEIWIQASYNPILDVNGKPFKVVKYATDVTQQARARMEVARIVSALASSSEELTAVSQQMGDTAQQTASQAGVVSAASEEVSRNIQIVATSAEEMSASIAEISKNTGEAARMATAAVQMAQATNTTVAKLGDSSLEIGKVIKVITSIAQQTNLLALNATIEAARAGEAGKGFAVVANEVKELAKETAKATEEIGQKIEAIQTDTKGAVAAIAQIDAIITNINNISTTIASAVEEQTATTNEIVRNVSEAAKGSTEIAQNITAVATTAHNTTQAAEETERSAKDLNKLAADLQQVSSQLNA